MNVGRRMSHPVITVGPDMAITKVHELMAHEKIHRAPVVRSGKLIGLVSEKDILKAYPSTATSLSVWELTALIEKIRVKDIMIKKVLTVQEDTPIEEAARIMADAHVGCLPVLRGEELTGIITETDLFRVMLEMLGARHPGVRASVLVPYRPGEIAQLTRVIFENGGNITALSTFEGDTTENFLITVKIEGIEQAVLERLVTPVVTQVLDISAC